jgi:hypothetical protein
VNVVNGFYAAWMLIGIAIGLLVSGAPAFAAVVALTAIVIVVTEPSSAERRDARRRNQAHRR